MFKKNKVLCAMSGGVDSSVAAALLKKDGYNVIGVFMKFWSEPSAAQNSDDAFSDAKKVADILDIPLYTVDFKKEFKKKVVDNFLKEYSLGKTPNPCVRCNKFIKFGLLFDEMNRYGAEYAASGHYARLSKKQENNKTIKQGAEYEVGEGGIRLLKAKDKNKDQSYFLYNLTQDKLKKLLFPVGGYTKLEARELAKKFKLPVHGRKESQEVCFTGGMDNYDFLRRHLKAVKGDIITVDGKKVGEHNGLPFYTIGQRRGIKIGGTGPYYVVELDFKNNRLIVASGAKHPTLMRDFLICKNVNWVSGQIPNLPLKCKARIRYGQREAEAQVFSAPQSSKERLRRSGVGEKYLVKFKTPQFAITAGQSVVFYKGDEVLGGGVIENF
ncbi:MAG: tRNA 2-thiouridine(34) synthase MnmA [bacterium]